MAQLVEHDVESARLLLARVLRVLVHVPDAVSVLVVTVDCATVFTVRVAHGDVSRVVGKDGRTLQALRVILASAGLKHQKRFNLDLEELPD